MTNKNDAVVNNEGKGNRKAKSTQGTNTFEKTQGNTGNHARLDNSLASFEEPMAASVLLWGVYKQKHVFPHCSLFAKVSGKLVVYDDFNQV